MLFQPEINSIQEDLLYHQKQLKEAQDRLDQVQISQAYSDTVISSLEDFLDNTDPFLYEVLKSHLNPMFDENKLTFNNDLKEEEKAPQEETNDYVEKINSYPIPSKQSEEVEVEVEEIIQDKDWTDEQKEELDWQEQLIRIAPNIFYDPSSSKCYMGFSAKGRADQYGSYLTRILDIAEKYKVCAKPSVTTNTKYELVLEQIDKMSVQHLSKFNLKKEYDDSKNKDARELWRNTRQRKHEPACKPLPKLTPLEDIRLGDIVYLNSINNQYKVMDKVELDGTPHLEVINVFNSERPSLVSAISYLKECYLVPVDEIRIAPQFQEVEQEEVLTEDVKIYVPVSEETKVKKSEELSEKDFSPGPYNSIKLTELEFGDSITSTPHSKSAYEVIAVNKEYATAVCLYHQALPGRVGEQYTFANPYLVEKSNQEMLATA